MIVRFWKIFSFFTHFSFLKHCALKYCIVLKHWTVRWIIVPAFCICLSITLSCSSGPIHENIGIEPTLGLIGGAILSTQNNGLIAQHPIVPFSPASFSHWNLINTLLNPIQDAQALSSCPNVTLGTCVDDNGDAPGENLQIFYNNCQSDGLDNAGYWRSYLALTFSSQALCDAVKASGFTSGVLTSLVGETVVKRYGAFGSLDQQNFRLATTQDPLTERASFYSEYPSGWVSTKSGGVEIEFISSTERQITIPGVHALASYYRTSPINPNASFDLASLDAGTSAWDQTINTVTSGEALYDLGPEISGSGSSVRFGNVSMNPTAPADGTIIVQSTAQTNTVQKGAVFKIQHNIDQGTSIAVVLEPLVYDDPNCCWPSSGVVESRYDRAHQAPTGQERLEFLSSGCGNVNYYTSAGLSNRTLLSHCF